MSRLVYTACLAVLSLNARPTRAETPLTLDRALDRLRQGPTGQVLRLRQAEARGSLAGARRLFSDNPSLTGRLGPRLGSSSSSRRLEGSVELVQPIALGGQRRGRVDGAEALAQAETASAEAALKGAEAEVAVAFFRALAGKQRENVAAVAEATSRRALEALERRHQLRDVALLDVNVARGALARATALLRAARADRLDAETDLKRLLALDAETTLVLAGDLRDQKRFTVQALVDRARDRAEIRALAAQARQAEAEAALGRAARWPRLALGGSYERDEGDDLVFGILSLELPLFERGQATSATGKARAERLAFEAMSARQATSVSIRGAHAAREERLSAVRVLEEAMPFLEQNDELARKSYDAGQLSLADWIVIRREVLETRLEYLDTLLSAAEAGVALAAAAGVSP